MTKYLFRVSRLVWGLFIFAIGVVFSINAQIGFAPWDVLHSGFAKQLHITIGLGIILAGVIIVGIVLLFGEPIGLGTIANMILVGLFTQVISSFNIVPQNINHNMLIGAGMMLLGMFLVAYGTYRYVHSGFGAGPRDSLMVIIARKTGWKIGVCRYAVEALVIVLGLLIGGTAGLGTLFGIIFISVSVQLVFKVMKFVPVEVEHENFKDTYAKIVRYYKTQIKKTP